MSERETVDLDALRETRRHVGIEFSQELRTPGMHVVETYKCPDCEGGSVLGAFDHLKGLPTRDGCKRCDGHGMLLRWREDHVAPPEPVMLTERESGDLSFMLAMEGAESDDVLDWLTEHGFALVRREFKQ